MKKPNIKLMAMCIGLLLFTGCASMPKDSPKVTHVYRVPCRVTSGSHDLQIFIATGSRANPLVTIADNNGYPTIKDFYARPSTMYGEDGIHVVIRFEAPAKGREISLNVYQEGMTRNFEVMPFKYGK